LPEDIPDRYTVGEEFFLDNSNIDVEILCFLACAVNYSSFKFDDKDYKVEGVFFNGFLHVFIKRKISEKLFERLNERNNNQFIVSYLDDVLAKVNEILLRQKYSIGHLLGNTYSTMNITAVHVKRLSDAKQVVLNWPLVIPSFDPAERLASKSDHVFIKDFIEAGSCFFSKNFDECIRKCVTAIDNYFLNIKMKGRFREKLAKLLVKANYLENWAPYLEILKHNINFIYDLRNKIVHDELRLTYRNSMICDKAFGTLSYLFRNYLNDNDTNKYIYRLLQEFKLIQLITVGMSLDELKKIYERKHQQKKTEAINTFEEFEKAIFSSLKISDDEKNEVLKLAS